MHKTTPLKGSPKNVFINNLVAVNSITSSYHDNLLQCALVHPKLHQNRFPQEPINVDNTNKNDRMLYYSGNYMLSLAEKL